MAPGALYKRERRRNRKHQLFNHLHPPNNSKHEGKNNRVEFFTFANSFPAEKKWDNCKIGLKYLTQIVIVAAFFAAVAAQSYPEPAYKTPESYVSVLFKLI
jgi:hypothetical protein